jgi:hypothetical protein
MDQAATVDLGWVGQLFAGRGDTVLMLVAALWAFAYLAGKFLETAGGPYLKALAELRSAQAAKVNEEAKLLALQVLELQKAPTISDEMKALRGEWAVYLKDSESHRKEIAHLVGEAAKMRNDPTYDRRGGKS